MAETITSKDLFKTDTISSDVLFRDELARDIVGEPPPRMQTLSPEEEVKQIGNIVDWSDKFEQNILTIEQLYEPIETLLKAVPDPKDVNIQAQEVERPSVIKEAPEEKKGVLESFLGFRYPPKPPDWERASLIEKFNFITLPISDFLGRVGGKIASGWRLMKKEDVQKLLVSELDEDLKWYQKTPEVVGWTAAKVAEFIALKGIFKVSGLHKAFTVAGQKIVSPFIAKEITAAGGMKAVSTMSAAGIKNLVRKSITSFLLAAPENTAFISSWSAFDAVMNYPALEEDRRQAKEIVDEFREESKQWSSKIAEKPEIAKSEKYKTFLEQYNKAIKQYADIPKDFPSAIKEAAISGAKWGLALTAGLAVIAPVTQMPELRLAFQKAVANVGKRYPGMLDKLGKPVTKEVEKEWLKAISKSRGKDVRLIDLTVRERQMFRNAIRAAEKEILKAAEREAAIEAYWGAKVAAKAAPTKPATKEIVKIVEDRPIVKPPTVPIAAPEKPVAPITKVKGIIRQVDGKWQVKFPDSTEFTNLAKEFEGKTVKQVIEKLQSLPANKGIEFEPITPEKAVEVEGILDAIEKKANARPYKPDLLEKADQAIKAGLAKRKGGKISLTVEGRQQLDTWRQTQEIERLAEGKAFDEGQEDLIQRIERGETVTQAEIDKYNLTGAFVEKAKIKPPTVAKAKPKAVEVAEKAIDKKVLESDDLGISDKEGIDMMPKGIALTPNIGAVRDSFNRAHDWMFTFGQASREDPELYDELMKAYGKRNAGVERAIDQVGRIIPKEIKIGDDVNMAMVYEDKRLSPKPEQKETYDKFKALLDEMSKKQKEEGLYSQPFNERMIEENNVKIEKILAENLQHPNKSKRIIRLRAENKILEEMRYLSHGIVAKRTIESKVNTLSGEKKTIYLQRLSAFYKKRKGKLFLKDYLEAGLITKEDMRMSRLATEEVADYYVRSAYKGLYDYGKAKGYVQPFSEKLHDEGWLTPNELGISSPELKDKIVHPLFGSALAEMKSMRIGRGGFVSQIFGMVKQGQWIKPTIVWVYDAIQKVMRGMYSFNPITEAKVLVNATRSVLTKDELYHNLNESNLFQFPYEISKGARDEEIAKFINQHSAEIDKVTKLLEKTFDTRWLDPDTTLGDMIKKIVIAAHRGMAQVTWAGDKIQRTQSYLILRKMGYPHDEAVKVASSSHGGYSLLSEKYKKFWSKKLFVYSFRVLMPIEMGKTIAEPIIAAKDAMGGARIPKHKWERMVKAVVGTAMIPIAIDEYMEWRGFKKEGKHLGPLAWKWSKEVTVDGETREIVVGINDILNMPVKYWNRITYYNPIDKTTRGIQVVKNLAKWEVHPIYRIWFWDISKNRKSFGSGVSVYDTEANPAVQFAQIAKYVFGQSFRFFGHTMDAMGEGNMTEKERAEQEKIFDSALSGADKMLFWALGYTYIRQPIEQRRAIMQKSLERELVSRLYEDARKYEGEDLEQRKVGLRRWAEKCEDWIQNEMK